VIWVKTLFSNEVDAMELLNIVGNGAMASDLAEIYISNIYGEKTAKTQKPYAINEKLGCWEVKGVIKKVRLGGVFEIHISKNDGRVLFLEHSK